MSTQTCEQTAEPLQIEKQDILLESGTNELELLVFQLGPTRYGVNVAKVREVIGQVEAVKVPKSHPAIVGVFNLRNTITPLVDLQLYFEPGKPSQAENRNVILMEFNNLRMGFLVDSVERIYRMSWDQVKPLPEIQANNNALITSVCEIDKKLALMVDFEKIAFDIGGRNNAVSGTQVAKAAAGVDRSSHRVLLAEDSPTIRNAIYGILTESGYANVVATASGAQAWTQLEKYAAQDPANQFTVVVTDIEMPEMDGLHLCKRIRENKELAQLPVVVFSSLVSDSNLKKCEAVGADAAITKPQLHKVVELLDALLTREKQDNAGKKTIMVVGEVAKK